MGIVRQRTGCDVVLTRYPEFLKLWSGQAISAFGSRITAVAMPLAAVLVLRATPLQMGVLGALAVVPHLLFGLPAGIWVDRLPRRRLLVAADVGRAVLLGAIPVLGVLGALRIEHLYAVVFLTGLMTLLYDTAATSFVPALVGRENLVRANGAWVLINTIAGTGGPSLAGWLVQVLTAPVAIAFDAASFLVSAGCTLLIRVRADPRPSGPIRLGAETVAGLRALFGSPILRPVTTGATLGALAGAIQSPLLVLYLVRGLGLTPALVGLALAVAGAASVAGALVARWCCERLGLGPTYLAGRVNAAWRFLVIGVQPLGALLGGALGATIGLRPTLVVSGLGVLLAFLIAFRSPVRKLRQIPPLAA